MADFKEAVKLMKEGKKVRREHWRYINNFALYEEPGVGLVFNNNRFSDKLTIKDIEAKDWEVYKEEDDWNLKNFEGFNEYEKAYASSDIILLKEKIIADIEADDYSFIGKSGKTRIKEILDERFGF